MTNLKIRDFSVQDQEILAKNEKLRTKPLVYTRTMGYYRPTEYFNTGKQGEVKERVCFEESVIKNLK